jgi:hypothetical protein
MPKGVPSDSLFNSQFLDGRMNLFSHDALSPDRTPTLALWLANTQSSREGNRVTFRHSFNISARIGLIGTGFDEDSVLHLLMPP